MTDETLLIDIWLTALLRGDSGPGGVATLSTGGVHSERDATGNSTYPKTIFKYQGGRYIQSVSGVIAALGAIYAIYGVAREPSFASLAALASRQRTLLHRQSGAPSGGLVLASVQIEPLRLAMLDQGVETRLLGGLYRIYSQQST